MGRGSFLPDKNRQTWHVNYCFIYIDNLLPDSPALLGIIFNIWNRVNPACRILYCDVSSAAEGGIHPGLSLPERHFKVEFTNNWLVKEIRSYCYSLQGIQDQKKRDILQIYILWYWSTKRKKLTERGIERELLDNFHKIKVTYHYSLLFVYQYQSRLIIYRIVLLYCQNSSAFYETKYYIAI